MPDLIGQTVGNYRIESLLGTGGVGQVYRARQLRLEREVAFKVLHPHFASDATFQARFLREAQAAAALNHPNIVQIHDFGEQDGLLYLVMELIEGGSLRGLLQRRANGEIVFPLSLSIDLIRQVADALAYAHHRGMVHRDIKAENLLLDERAERGGVRPYLVKVTDFGLARLQDGHQLTSAGKVLGTPATMSPEQCRGEELDGRSDQYSLGVVLYEVVTGQLPFEIKGMTDAVYKHIYVAPPPPRSIQPNIPARLEQIILRCLEKDPAARYPSMTDLSRELQASTQPPQPGVPVDIASPTLTELAYTPAPATPTPTPTPTPAPAPGIAAPDLNLRTQYEPPPQPQPQPTPPSSDQNFQTQIDQQPQQPQQPQSPQWQSPQPQWQPPPVGPGATPAGPMVTHLNDRGASPKDQPPPIPWMTGQGAGSPPGGAPPMECAGARPEPTASQQERAARPTAPMATAAGAPYRPARRTPLLLSLAGGVVLLSLLGWAFASGRIGGDDSPDPTAPGSGGVIVATATGSAAPTAPPTAAPTLAAVLPTAAPATPAPTAVPTAVPIPAATTLHPSGRILFSCGRGSPPERLEICAINGDGSGLQIVTHDAVDDLTPTVSPDGKQIAFTSTRDGRNQIYVMDATGQNQRRLVDSPTVDEIPTWAPVGRQIAFIRARTNPDRSDIVVVNDDGSGLINLTEASNASNWSPSWSPDGMRIAFVSNRNGNNEIYTVGNDGTNPRRLTTSPGSDEAPNWSPDGKQIVFISTRDGNGEVYTMNADGSNPRRLTNTNGSESDPTWSPDGTTIAFARPVGTGREIGLMNPDGGNQRQLTTGAAFDSWLSWSPDSQRLVYMSPREGNMESYVAPADGSPIIRLTNDLNFDGNPRWVPGR